jgi:hypothetical protein
VTNILGKEEGLMAQLIAALEAFAATHPYAASAIQSLIHALLGT